MASTARKGIFMPTDMLYLLTFGLGMLGFWVSGRAGKLMPAMPNGILGMIVSITAVGAIYGLIMFALAYVVTRRLVPTFVSTLVAVILGIVTAQVIVRAAAGHINSSQDVGILTFVLYLCYGTIYVIALAIGRKIAKNRAA